MDIKQHTFLQVALTIFQPVIPTLPVSEEWNPFLHALAGGVASALALWNHYKTPSGGSVSDLNNKISNLKSVNKELREDWDT